MTNSRELKTYESELEVLETVTQAYGQIASIRMKLTRDSVLKARDFLADLANVFEDVRLAYLEKRRTLAYKLGKHDLTFLSHNGKTVSVLLSSNTGLYGDIVRRTFQFFVDDVAKSNAEATIVGRQGLSLFQSYFPHKQVTYFDIPDHGFTQDQLMKVIRHVVKYDRVDLFFGRFHTVLTQQPEKLTIDAKLDVEQSKSEVKHKKYLFEPSIERILQFFESELFASLFEQSIRESQLSKFASRIIAMDQATENIKVERKKLRLQQFAAIHRAADRKQLNSLPAIMMNTT